MDIKNIIQEFKEQLKVIYKDNLKDVILFGSRARGDFTEESDIDILIVLANIANREEEFNRVFRIEREVEERYDNKVIISAVVTTQHDYSSGLQPLYLNVQREGVSII
jgi:Predicted nucleotidyltransferases